MESTQRVYGLGLSFVSARTNKRHHHHHPARASHVPARVSELTASRSNMQRGCLRCRILNAKSIEMTRGCAKCGSMEMTRRCAKCGHSSTILSASVYEKLPCSKSINPAHVVRAYWLSPLNIQSVLTQDATKSLGPSSALCQGGDACVPSSLKTAMVSRVTHHAHDTQKPKSTARAVTPSGTGGGM